MLYLTAYLATLLIFVGVDLIWLTWVGGPMYRSLLGDALLPSVRMMPALAFYLIYPLGLTAYAVYPALTGGNVLGALIAGALFGFFTYATYDLTNYATLRSWSLAVTAMDIAWGVVLGALASVAALSLTTTVATLLGLAK
jgi:uncharacterized membrane protein